MSLEELPLAIVLSSGMNGLGAVRALGERGVRVVVIAESAADIALRSRYPSERYSLHHSRQDAGIDELQRLLAGLSFERAVVIPTSDWFVSAVRSARMRLRDGYSVVAPAADVAEMLLDKAVETARIGQFLPIPKTLSPLPNAPEEMLELLRLPIIVKPRSFAHMCLGAKNIILRSAEDVGNFYARFPDVRSRVVAQEVIEGPDDNLWVCHAVFDKQHMVVNTFTFRRLRLSPPHYGVTSYAVSEDNSTVTDLVAQLGRELNYVGPAMVEFKWDPRDKSYRYIELNPRLGLTNYFDARCGSGMAYISYCVAADVPVPMPPVQQKDGVVFVSLYEDIYSRRLDGESISGMARHYLSMTGRRHVFAYWSVRDPLPGITMLRRHLVQILAGAARKVRRSLQ